METERMTPGEIRRNYEAAKDKQAQIVILAEMNLCSKKDIERIVFDGAESLPPIKRKYCQTDPETRKKIAMEYMAGGVTKQALAEKYGVSEASVIGYINKYRAEMKSGKAAPPKKPKAPPSAPSDVKDLASITATFDKLFDAVSVLMESTETNFADYERFSITKTSNILTCSMERDGLIINISKFTENEEDE